MALLLIKIVKKHYQYKHKVPILGQPKLKGSIWENGYS